MLLSEFPLAIQFFRLAVIAINTAPVARYRGMSLDTDPQCTFRVFLKTLHIFIQIGVHGNISTNRVYIFSTIFTTKDVYIHLKDSHV